MSGRLAAGRCCPGCPGCPECPDWYARQAIAAVQEGAGPNGHELDLGVMAAALSTALLLAPAKGDVAPISEADSGPVYPAGRCQRCGGLLLQAEVDPSEPMRCLICARPTVAARAPVKGELSRSEGSTAHLRGRSEGDAAHRGGYHKRKAARKGKP